MLTLDGGTVDLGDKTASLGTTDYWSGNGNGTVRIYDGSWTCRTIHVGAHDGAVGLFEITNGTVTANCQAWWPGGVNVGWGASTGTMRVSDSANVDIAGGLYVGRSGGSHGTFEMSGGTVSIHDYNAGINVGLDSGSTGSALISGGSLTMISSSIGEHGSGSMTITGGKVTIGVNGWEHLRLGVSDGGEGYLHLVDGEVYVAGSILLGVSNGVGRLVMDGGTLRSNHVLSFHDNVASEATGGEAWLNGGVLTNNFFRIGSALPTAKATLNFNGCEVVSTGARSWDGEGYTDRDVIPADERLTVNVLVGGMVIVAGEENINISHPLSGSGALVKRGPMSLAVNGDVSLGRGFRVEGGSLSIASGKLARTNFKEIAVAEGCSLDLNGAEVTVASYTLAGVAQPAGDYHAHNGTIHVMSAASLVPSTAIWLNETGDGDVTNVDNWSVKTADGTELFDILPTADTDVLVPATLPRPDLSGLTVGSVALLASSDVFLRGDCTVPAVVKTAKCWYDFDDSATVSVEGDVIQSVANKGTGGSDLDMEKLPEPSAPYYGVDTVNGRNVLSSSIANDGDGKAIKTFGLGSKGALGIEGSHDVAIVAVSCRHDASAANPHYAISIETPQNIYYAWQNDNWPGAFRIDREEYTEAFHYVDATMQDEDTLAYTNHQGRTISPGQDPAGWRISMLQSKNLALTASMYSDEYGLTGSSATANSLNIESTARLYLGYRRMWNSESSGKIAEALCFDKALTDEEMTEVRTYLYNKWFTDADMSNIPANVALENNATLDFGGGSWTFAAIKGAGTIGNANVTVTSSVQPGLVVDGTLTFGAGSGIDFSTLPKPAEGDEIVLVTCNGLTGDPAVLNWKFGNKIKLQAVDNGDGTVSVVGTVICGGFSIMLK